MKSVEFEEALPTGERLWVCVDYTGNYGGGLPGVELAVRRSHGPGGVETRLPTKGELRAVLERLLAALPD